MLKNRRLSQRYTLRGAGKIQFPGSKFPRDCLITDVSDGGVRLHIEGVDVPDEFTLWFAATSGERRDCRVAWRLGYELGAEFTDTARRDFGRHVARSHGTGRR